MADLSKYGAKFTCFSCGCKFYDLNRPTAVCPKCGSDQANAPKIPVATKKVAAPARVVVDEEPEFDAEDAEDVAGLDPDEFPTIEETEEFEEDLSEDVHATTFGD